MLIECSLREAKKENFEYFVVDAALLFEANFNHFFDYIILITADEKKRLDRALRRKNIDLSQIKKRMALQLSDKEKIDSSDFVIYNNNNKNDLKKEFQNILKQII